MEEQAHRQNKNLLYRLKGARIPSDFTLKTFPFDRQPGVSKAQIRELSGLAFVERKQNIVFIGNPGTGKSGLATGLLRQALLSGYRGRGSTMPKTFLTNFIHPWPTDPARSSSSICATMMSL